MAAAGCGGSSAVSQPVARTTPSRGTGALVIPMSANAMQYLKRHLYSARFLSATRVAIPGIAGSSNCPSVPSKLAVRSRHAVRVDLVVGSWSRTASGRRVRVPHSPNICLDDLVPTPVVISIDPRRIDVHDQLKVSLYYPKGVIRRYERPVVFTVPPLA
jgi:hypothetical protein